MSRDTSHTHLHLHLSSHSTLLEDFTRGGPLPPDEIYLPPEYQPLNPEDEEDVVPAMHAAFGIQRAAAQRGKGEGWRDLGLEKLMEGGIGVGANGGKVGSGSKREGGDALLEGFRREGQDSANVGRTLQTRRRVDGSAGARLRG